MYNPYITSTLSPRCRGSVSYSFNDYAYFPTEYRFDRHLTSLSSSSSSSCFCACCAANSVHRVSISPRFLYGLRQSSLIQWSASRRLILRGEDQYWFRIPVHDLGQNCCCGHVCHVRERGSKRGEGKFRRMVSEGKSERHCSFEYDDAEMMLSLLTEEVGEECYGAREKKYRVSRRVEVKKKGNIGDTSYKKKKNVGSGFSGSKAKCEFEYEKIKSAEEDNSTRNDDRRTADEEMFLKGEKRRGRKPGSSCSSYYSCSSLGDLESDNEVQARGEEDNEELSSRYRRDSQESIKVRDDAENVKVIKRNENIIGAGKTFESDWRKKSEKKLNDASVELSESMEESLQNQRKLSEVHETGHHHQASSAHEKFDGIEEKSASWITESESRRQYSRKSDQVTGVSESGMKQKHFSGVQEISSSDVEAVSSSQKHFGKREENSNVAESLALDKRNEDAKTIGHISRKDDYRINAKQSNQVSQIQDMYVRRTNTSEKQSEARIENQVDRSSVVLSSIQDTEKYHHLTGQSEFRQMDSRRKSQQSAEISAKEQHVQSGHTAIRKKQSAKGSQEMSTISLGHSSDAQVTDIQRTSENRISSKETYSESVLKSTEKTTKHHEISEDRVFQVGSRKETEGTSNRVSSSKTSLILESTPILHHDGLVMGDKSSSQAIVIGPTSEFPSTSLGTVSDALHTKVELNAPPVKHEMYKASALIQTHEDLLSSISQEDKLGSAQRFQKSSTQIVGEFIEKATHEVSSSQSQEEGKTPEEEVLIEGHKNEQKSLSRSGYVDIKLKEQDSRRSSRSSGVKGPSDEIWDVMGPSTQEFVDTQVPESSDPTENTVAKRTGRSLWNIFSDIVRLRWASHAKTHDSTAKSGGKSSPNQSTSSETWFSGHQRDENSEENLKRENKSMSRESIATPTGSQGEGYSSSSSKDKLGNVGLELLPSSSKTASGSEPKDSSSVSPEEDLKTIGAKVVESSVSLPSLQIRRYSSTDEVAESDKPDLSASDSLAGKEQLIGTRPINVPGSQGKDGVLTRRKLQRTNQVMKDRFDEWEEAYMLESERRKIDEMFMKEALLEAKKAADIWEVPVGAVLVQHGKIIARGYNLVEELRDSTAHAEIICIREASNQLRTWRLSGTTLYVTLEPCPMCAGAILQARIDTVVWGAPNKLLGADGSWIRLFPSGGEGINSSESTDKPPAPVHPFHPKIAIRRGVLGAECADVMQQFFQLRRRKKEKKQPDTPPTPSCLPISNHPTKILSKMHDVFHFMFCL